MPKMLISSTDNTGIQGNNSSRRNSSELPLEAFSKVVEAIYDCALDPNRWHDTVPLIAELFQSQRCVFGVHDYANDSNELAFQLGYEDEEYWRLHEGKYRALNPFFAPIQLLPVGTVSTQAMLLDDDEFLESKYYQEWCKPQGLRDFISLKVLQTGQRMGLLVANRVESHPRYGDAEVRLLTLLSRMSAARWRSPTPSISKPSGRRLLRRRLMRLLRACILPTARAVSST